MRAIFIATACTALLAAVSCGSPLASNASAKNDAASASLSLSWSNSSAARTIAPVDAASGLEALASYDLVCTASGFDTVTKTVSGSTATVTGLAKAAWTVAVNGKNASGSLVARGTGSVDLSAGDAALSVFLYYIVSGSGTGGLDVSFSWPILSDPVASVSCALTDNSGGAVDLSGKWTLDTAGRTAALKAGALPIGTATAALVFKDAAGTTLASRVESIVLLLNTTTKASVAIASKDFCILPTGVSVSPTVLNIDVDEKAILGATITPSDASSQSITWSSSDPLIATVDAATGVVTGTGNGTATIKATIDQTGIFATCTVHVTMPV